MVLCLFILLLLLPLGIPNIRSCLIVPPYTVTHRMPHAHFVLVNFVCNCGCLCVVFCFALFCLVLLCFALWLFTARAHSLCSAATLKKKAKYNHREENKCVHNLKQYKFVLIKQHQFLFACTKSCRMHTDKTKQTTKTK